MPIKPTHNNDVGLEDLHYNPLQNYRNVTYNTRLTMMPPAEMAKKDGRLSRSFDYKQGIIIWETGGTGTTYLEELTIESMGPGNHTGNYFYQAANIFKGRIVEPLGGRLIEAISLAAMQMGYNNNQDAGLLLEIDFKGYDTDSDMPVTCKSWEDEDLIFRWYITINQLKMRLDYKGSTYDFELMSAEGAAALNDFTTLETSFKMEGKPGNIGDFCKQMTIALNKKEEYKVKTGRACFPHKWVITPHKDIAGLSFNYSFAKNVWSFFFGPGDIQASPGTSIQQFIVGAMPNSQEVLKYLHRIPEKKDFNSMDTKDKTSHLPIRTWAIICGARDLEEGGQPKFDQKRGTTVKEIHYFITTKEDARAIITPDEYKDATDPEQRKKRVDNWIKKGYLRKVYKWIYTGENTEVIRTDLKIDNLWRQVRPLWMDENGNPIGATGSAPPSKEPPKGQSSSKVAKCQDARKVSPPNKTGKTFYAEDMPFKKTADTDISPKEGWYPHQPKFYDLNMTVGQQSSTSAVYQESAQEYSIYRQVANNMSQGAQEMVSMELEVVGDPYWLCQIPNKPGTPPWNDDVWQYEKDQLTEDSMAEKRKITSTSTTLGFIYFEAQIPSVDYNAQDTMELRRSDAISGVYLPYKVVNKFSKGKFTTKLSLLRESLCNPWDGKQNATTATNNTKDPKSATSTGPKNAAPRKP
ncbi:hypothetical protein UFOVP71_4 [uncultured Caudovirales phage]|uniref:Uncharacterized protein n=1 Tax=uncultured Caudovirales phage TaxID=2100421 RepID=A0A6J5T9A7_9CAUD|nr:hypothetical protein UFOVP71_4 [uncultured Caudovirales phage]